MPTAKYACRAVSSIAQRLPLVWLIGGRKGIAENLPGAFTRPYPRFAINLNLGRRYDVRYCLSEARYPDWPLRLGNLLQQRQALGLKFRDSDFLHGFLLTSILTIVNVLVNHGGNA